MEVRVFMVDDYTGQDTNYRMDYYYTVDKSHAEEMAEAGKAIVFEGGTELDHYDTQISNEVEAFKKAYDKIAESKDPRYKDPDFFAEEVGKLKAELDEKVASLQAEYEEVVKAAREEAQRARANLSRNITQEDERGASQLINELVSVAKLDGIDEAIERIENDMQYYTEGRKAAIANELYRLVDVVADDDRTSKRRLRSLANRLREDSEGVELAARMALALPDYTGTAYNTLKLTHRAYKRR